MSDAALKRGRQCEAAHRARRKLLLNMVERERDLNHKDITNIKQDQ